ncbi:MAG: hypothetical protein KDC98_19385, partial [Planctomycetes bacterium]|nr:hypothetical protein [Planctomycetota bacterium]
MQKPSLLGSILTLASFATIVPAQNPVTQGAAALDKDFASEAATSARLASESEAWQRFLGEAGGEWTSRWCAATATPRMAFGSGVPLAGWRQNSIEEARRHALQFLNGHDELLGLGTSEFREAIGSRMGRTWCFVYDQYFRGLPVIDGRADVRVHMVGRIAAFGSR